MNYKAQTTQFKGKNFQNTVPVFCTEKDAMEYAEQCADRSQFIADYRVVESSAIATHSMWAGKLTRLQQLALEPAL